MTTLIKQRTNSDCVLAAIAMAAGKDYDELWTTDDVTKVVKDGGVSDEEPYMERAGFKKGVTYKRVSPWDINQAHLKNFLWGRRALLSIHSLNIPDGHHMVYWDGEEVFDPSPKDTYKRLHPMLITSVVLFKG